jgi:hypothetical protein
MMNRTVHLVKSNCQSLQHVQLRRGGGSPVWNRILIRKAPRFDSLIHFDSSCRQIGFAIPLGWQYFMLAGAGSPPTFSRSFYGDRYRRPSSRSGKIYNNNIQPYYRSGA